MLEGNAARGTDVGSIDSQMCVTIVRWNGLLNYIFMLLITFDTWKEKNMIYDLINECFKWIFELANFFLRL